MKQTKNKKHEERKGKDKRALSLMIEYVLLVVFSIVLAIIVYAVLKTYVPQNKITCPEGTSLLIENYNYDCGGDMLTFDIRNTGRFNVGGYFIYVTDNQNEELATVDIHKNNTDPLVIFPDEFGVNGVKIGNDGNPETDNDFEPNQVEPEEYDLEGIDNIYSVMIIPFRWQVEKNVNRIVSCADEVIKKDITCT